MHKNQFCYSSVCFLMAVNMIDHKTFSCITTLPLQCSVLESTKLNLLKHNWSHIESISTLSLIDSGGIEETKFPILEVYLLSITFPFSGVSSLHSAMSTTHVPDYSLNLLSFFLSHALLQTLLNISKYLLYIVPPSLSL